MDTYDVVVVGAGGAGMAAAAAAAQNGATVLVIEKMAEIGGNTIVAGGPFQSAEPSLAWNPDDPEAAEAVYEVTGETVPKMKMDVGRLDTLRMILDWSEEPFDETVEDASAIKDVNDYRLPERGVHAAYLPTLQTLKGQIRDYLKWADAKIKAGARETDLTLFSTIELHIFQTYYGGLRLNGGKDRWIASDFDLVKQMCEEALNVKPWLISQGSVFVNSMQITLIGCMWQRVNVMAGGVVDGQMYENKWGAYFMVPRNTLLSANEKNSIMLRTTAKELMVENGRVTGVKAVQHDGTEVEITANKGVIITTGGYAANVQMVMDTNDYWDEKYLTNRILTTNRNLSQGEGIVMGQAAGAGVVGMEWTQLMPLGWVDNGNLAGGTGENVIYISPAGTPNAGKRYVDEAAERDVLSQGAFDYGAENGVYVEIANAGVEADPNFDQSRVTVGTLSEVAALLEIDEEVLRQTITEYDAFIIGASDTPSQPAKSGYRGTIGDCEQDANGNYLPETYKIGRLQVRFMAPSTHHTMGGLTVDTGRHVLSAAGDVIPGLYAAGEVTGGFFAGNRLGANAILEIIVSGKIAGENAAKAQ
ncbi:MAG: FAD-dependent oxidoreductase [Clostridiales bacterium]|nr:FAD-dependent oxidoreductase [Clostridiales bacterium]